MAGKYERGNKAWIQKVEKSKKKKQKQKHLSIMRMKKQRI